MTISTILLIIHISYLEVKTSYLSNTNSSVIVVLFSIELK